MAFELYIVLEGSTSDILTNGREGPTILSKFETGKPPIHNWKTI
jgi:hypothetical protein